MGQLIKQTSCEACGSSDANSVYLQEDGSYNATCFSCGKFIPNIDLDTMTAIEFSKETVNKSKASKKDNSALVEDITLNYQTRGIKERKLRKQSCEFYGIKVSYDEDDNTKIAAHYYPFTKDGKVVGYQRREVATKKFKAVGYAKQDIEFVGQSLFKRGGKSVIITEGALDAVAVHQTLFDKYGEKAYNMPVVSLPNGANSKGTIEANWDWLNSFGKVVLMFDNDKVGKSAAKAVAKMLPAGKAFIAELSEKDPCDVVKAGKSQELISAYFDASAFTPAGLVASANTWDILLEHKNMESIPFPPCMEGVNEKTYGRRLGQITLFTSGTGMGKTSFLREDHVHILDTTDYKIGVCSLEEGVADTVLGIMSVRASKRLQLPDVEYTDEEFREYWESTMASNRFMFLDHQGSVVDDSLFSKIEYMVACGCQIIYLDHITIAVSESGHNTNEAIDKLMSDLLKLVKRHNVWIGVVSHLRKVGSDSKSFEEGAVPSEDDLKGSGSIKQIAFDTIAFARNKYAKDPEARNTTSIHVLKCRFTGRTGYAGMATFDDDTGRLYHTSDNELRKAVESGNPHIEDDIDDSEFSVAM